MKKRLQITKSVQAFKPRPAVARRPALAGLGRLRKIAIVGGASTLRHTPWFDPTWEIWAHHSCRHQCQREPDLYFDMHPPSLWKDPAKKFWDPDYQTWLKANRTPIMMQEVYPEAPTSIKYPFSTMITEFPTGYMTNTVSYMVALALMEGVTHLGVYGCHYDTGSEYGPQRGSCEYWLGLAEGRGVHVLIPPGCDLLNRPHLLYGYESHPNGVRDASYTFTLGPGMIGKHNLMGHAESIALLPADGPTAPPLMDIGMPPALDRRDGPPQGHINGVHVS